MAPRESKDVHLSFPSEFICFFIETSFAKLSILHTNSFQDSLPKLPIPPLNLTLQRYLLSQRPLLSDKEFDGTAVAVKAFAEGVGPLLDQELRENDEANPGTSYVNGLRRDMYLSNRRPLVFTDNVGFIVADWKEDNMALAAARATRTLIEFFKDLKEETLAPEVFAVKGVKIPLDMSQFKYLFQTTRVPGTKSDSIKFSPLAKNILVLVRGHMYSFPGVDDDWKIFPTSVYLQAFNSILQDCPKEMGEGVGALTALPRKRWAADRDYLSRMGGNAKLLEQVDSALTLVCLDEDFIHEEGRIVESMENVIVGTEPANRWFDKSLALIVSKNGHLGVNMEHSHIDGLAVKRLFHYMRERKGIFPTYKTQDQLQPLPIKRLEFTLDEMLHEEIVKARLYFKLEKKSVTFSHLQMHTFGRDRLIHHGLSPDGFLHVAFQAANHRMEGGHPGGVVSGKGVACTARFLHGRTESVNTGTLETRAFVEAFNRAHSDESLWADRPKLLFLLHRSCLKHKELVTQAQGGHGWDRHLFALRHLCQSKGRPLPALFLDPAYNAIMDHKIMASTSSSPVFCNGGWCPSHEGQLGIAYQAYEDRVSCIISAFYDSQTYRDCLEETLADMGRIAFGN